MASIAPRSALRAAISGSRSLRPIAPPQILRASSSSSSSSSSVTPRQPLAPLPMPPNQPREDYIAPTLYTLSYLSRALRLVIYTALGLTAAGLAGYEGFHLYIENVLLKGSYPGWEEVHQGWTGVNGGTSSKLGWRARHALRGAYLLQEHGSGSARGSIGAGGLNAVDRGYDEAREYLRVAIDEAHKKGIIFPSEGVQADREGVELTLLKAGVLERIASPDTLTEAKGLYEDVYRYGSIETTQKMRLCAKIGDMAQRLGEDGKEWWLRGLSLAGIDLAATVAPPSIAAAVTEKPKSRGWFSSKPAPATMQESSTQTSLAHVKLADQTRRLALTLLVSLEASLATSGSLSAASTVQNAALSLIPVSTGADLNSAWLEHRRALVVLHQASVAHAASESDRALLLAQSAQTGADAVLSGIPEQDSPPGKQLHKDALSLAAEAAYTRGVLLERSGKAGTLEMAKDLFERARSLTEGDQAETEARAGAEGAAGQGGKYWRAWARVQAKLDGTAKS